MVALAAIAFLVTAPAGRGQSVTEGREPWRVVSFVRDAGLEEEAIFHVVVDRHNVVWIASSAGLVRYDGYAWRRFGRADGLPSNYVRCMALTTDGELWVGTDRGIARMREGRFETPEWGGALPGPSVRRITVDGEGALWFCCDRWPDPSVRGGLARWAHGRIELFGSSDGLPTDYVSDCVDLGEDGFFVLTRRGLVERRKGRWIRPLAPLGRQAEDYLWAVFPDTRGLVALTSRTVFVEREGRWSRAGELPPAWSRSKVVRTAAHEILSLERGRRPRFVRWAGDGFTPVSAPCPVAVRNVESLCVAPDGAIWAVGAGTILRWERESTRLEFHPGLPQPVLAGRDGTVWFADGSAVARWSGKGFQALPDVKGPLTPGGDGEVWMLAEDAIVAWRDGRFVTREKVSGVDRPDQICRNPGGEFWVKGRTAAGRRVLAHGWPGAWTLVNLPLVDSDRVIFYHPASDGGVWLLVRRAAGGHRLLRVNVRGVEESPLPAEIGDTTTPAFLDDGRDGLWAYGLFGLFHKPAPGQPWRRIENLPGRHVLALVGADDGVLLAHRATTGGRSGMSLLDASGWHRVPGSVGRYLGASPDRTLYFAHPRGVLGIPGSRRSSYVIELPAGLEARSVLGTAAGDLWVGLEEGVLRVRRRTAAPETLLADAPRRIPEGRETVVRVGGALRFEPAERAAALFLRTRLDGGSWSEGALGAGRIVLPPLAPGPHLLEAAVVDPLGAADSTPLQVRFEVAPTPLQHRVWFPWAVVVLIAGMTALVVAAFRARWRLRRHARELETVVWDRTRSLREELARRRWGDAERALVEDQLRHAQKMEAMGRLAGAVAHDFNNLLTAILGNAELMTDVLRAPTGRDGLLAVHLREIERAGKRASALTRQLLAFSRKQVTRLADVRIADVLADMGGMLERLLPENVELQISVAAPDATVHADAGLLEQVVVNLVINACDAMAENGGRVEILVEEDVVDEARARRVAELRPGRYVRLRVRDQGCGMAPEVIERAFEPFYTTKPAGQGTGLGLSTVHGIVKQADGHVWIESAPMAGTTVELLLPAVVPAPARDRDERDPVARGQHEAILLCEDDPAVRRLLSSMLSDHGYRVTACSSGMEALEVVTRGDSFDLLLTDLAMPGMSGKELAGRLRRLRPDLAVLFVSGYPDRILGHEAEGVELLAKPFVTNELLERVRRILDERRVS